MYKTLCAGRHSEYRHSCHQVLRPTLRQRSQHHPVLAPPCQSMMYGIQSLARSSVYLGWFYSWGLFSWCCVGTADKEVVEKDRKVHWEIQIIQHRRLNISVHKEPRDRDIAIIVSFDFHRIPWNSEFSMLRSHTRANSHTTTWRRMGLRTTKRTIFTKRYFRPSSLSCICSNNIFLESQFPKRHFRNLEFSYNGI